MSALVATETTTCLLCQETLVWSDRFEEWHSYNGKEHYVNVCNGAHSHKAAE